jgi:hypothetical protein
MTEIDDDNSPYQPDPQRVLNREERLRRDRALRTGTYRGQPLPAEVLAEMRDRHAAHLARLISHPEEIDDQAPLIPVARYRYTGDLPRERGEPPWTWTVYECGLVTLRRCSLPGDRDFEAYFAAGRHLDQNANYRPLSQIARAFGTTPLKIARWLQFRDPEMCADLYLGGPGRPLRPR